MIVNPSRQPFLALTSPHGVDTETALHRVCCARRYAGEFRTSRSRGRGSLPGRAQSPRLQSPSKANRAGSFSFERVRQKHRGRRPRRVDRCNTRRLPVTHRRDSSPGRRRCPTPRRMVTQPRSRPNAQHVRLFPEVLLAGTVANPLHRHRWLVSELVHNCGQDGGAGRRGPVRPVTGWGQRHAAKQHRGRGRGDRHEAVAHLTVPLPGGTERQVIRSTPSTSRRSRPR